MRSASCSLCPLPQNKMRVRPRTSILGIYFTCLARSSLSKSRINLKCGKDIQVSTLGAPINVNYVADATIFFDASPGKLTKAGILLSKSTNDDASPHSLKFANISSTRCTALMPPSVCRILLTPPLAPECCLVEEEHSVKIKCSGQEGRQAIMTGLGKETAT